MVCQQQSSCCCHKKLVDQCCPNSNRSHPLFFNTKVSNIKYCLFIEVMTTLLVLVLEPWCVEWQQWRSVYPRLSQLQQTSNHTRVSWWAELCGALCVTRRVSRDQNNLGCTWQSRVEVWEQWGPGSRNPDGQHLQQRLLQLFQRWSTIHQVLRGWHHIRPYYSLWVLGEQTLPAFCLCGKSWF